MAQSASRNGRTSPKVLDVTLGTTVYRLVALSLLPLLLAFAGLIYHLFVQQRQMAENDILADAMYVSRTIDSEVQRWRTMVETLAQTRQTDPIDPAATYQGAMKIVADQPGARIGLVARNGQQLFSTAHPYGTPLPNVFALPAPSDALELERQAANNRAWSELFSGQRGGYSNLYRSGSDAHQAIAFRLPVPHGKQIAYALTISFEPRHLIALLQPEHKQASVSRAATILDRRNVVLAQSAASEQLVGALTSPPFVETVQSRPFGVVRGVSSQGTPLLAAFTRSAQTGWLLWTALPTAAAEQNMRRSTAIWLAIMLLLVGVSLAAARRTWREVGEPLGVLAANAAAFERGEPVIVPPTSIRELRHCGLAWSLAVQADRSRRDQERLLIAAQTRQREAEQASREKDRILGALGHELRNPLGAISNSVQLLQTVGAGSHEARVAIGIIKRQCLHLSELMEHLLDLASATFGKMPIDSKPVELLALLRQLVGEAPFSAQDHAKLTVSGEAAWVRGDAKRLTQALRNVIQNAIKFTPVAGFIDIAVRRRADTAVILVTDTGAGIAPRMIERLFAPFVQNEQSLDRAQGGLGLGLALAREIVKLHGGRVAAISAGPGEGTQVHIELPGCAQPEYAVKH